MRYATQPARFSYKLGYDREREVWLVSFGSVLLFSFEGMKAQAHQLVASLNAAIKEAGL